MVRLRKKKKNPYEASLIQDNDAIKIVEARYEGKPIFFGVGVARGQTKKIEAGVSPLTVSAGGAYAKEKKYDWELFYNPDNMPGFLPMEQFKQMAVATTTLTSGSPDAMQALIKPLPEEEFEPTKGIKISKKYIKIIKGTARIEIAKKEPVSGA